MAEQRRNDSNMDNESSQPNDRNLDDITSTGESRGRSNREPVSRADDRGMEDSLLQDDETDELAGEEGIESEVEEE